MQPSRLRNSETEKIIAYVIEVAAPNADAEQFPSYVLCKTAALSPHTHFLPLDKECMGKGVRILLVHKTPVQDPRVITQAT